MYHELFRILILLLGGILAGTIDTVIGGGGLFSVPTLLLTGLSPQATLGTNQFALSFGSLVGTVKFSQKGNVRWWPETILCAIGAIPGTVLGGMTALSIPPDVLHIIVISLLAVVGVVVLFKRNVKDNEIVGQHVSLLKCALVFLLGIGIGFYEGFFGPGSGILIIFAFIMWIGFGYVRASGSAKVISLIGNLVAFITYALHGDVRWVEGLIMAGAVSIGAYAGAYVAQRGGRRVIRPLMLGVTGLLVVNVLVSVFLHT